MMDEVYTTCTSFQTKYKKIFEHIYLSNLNVGIVSLNRNWKSFLIDLCTSIALRLHFSASK